MARVVNLAEKRALNDLQTIRQKMADLAQSKTATQEDRRAAFREYDDALGRLKDAAWGSAC